MMMSFIKEISNLADEFVANPVFTLLDDVVNIKHQLNQDVSNFPCSYLWRRMVINYDGIVTICCRDYNCMNIMGDFNIQSLKDIWNGKEYSEMRSIHTAMLRNTIPVCSTCGLY